MSEYPLTLPGLQPEGPLLAFDTSTSCMTAVVIKGGRLLAERHMQAERNHSLHLMPMIGALLDSVSLAPRELAGIAAGRGPGSYTGVRIGITAAKTMAWSLKLPVLSVSSLEALALGGWQPEGPAAAGPQWLVPLMDARRGQAYTALYQGVAAEAAQEAGEGHAQEAGEGGNAAAGDADGGQPRTRDGGSVSMQDGGGLRTRDGAALRWSCLRQDCILPMAAWLDELLERARSAERPPQLIAFLGEAGAFAELTERFASLWTAGETTAYDSSMRAYDIGRLAGARMARGLSEDPHALVPNYAQLAEAEAKLQAKRE